MNILIILSLGDRIERWDDANYKIWIYNMQCKLREEVCDMLNVCVNYMIREWRSMHDLFYWRVRYFYIQVITGCLQ